MVQNKYLRFPGGFKKAFTISYDDGVMQDIKLIELMEKYNIKGTFNLNSGLYAAENVVYEENHPHKKMSKSVATKAFNHKNVEVAIHGLTHPFLEQLSSDMIAYEVITDRADLENQFGKIINGMAYPYGTYSDAVVDVLKICGIKYARTTISNYAFNIPNDWLRLETTCHHNDPRLNELTDKFIDETIEKYPYLFYLWGHSYEFDADKNWDVIENLFIRLSKCDDVWFATNMELYDYINAYNNLDFSCDGKHIKNNSKFTIYLTINGIAIEVLPN